MKIKPYCFLLPKGTSKRLRALARNDESQSDVLLRAIKGLEGSPSSLVTKPPEVQVGEILKRFDDVASSVGQLAARVTAVESRGETTVKADEPPPVVSAPVSVLGNAGDDAPQASGSAEAPDKKSSRLDYPPEVRRIAVDMRREGKKSADILAAIHNQCGHAPDSRNLQKRLNTWEKELAQEAVSPTSAVVVPVVPTPAIEAAVKDTPQADATPAQDKKSQRFVYPPEVRRMAVDLRKQGEGTDAIIAAIQKECGQAPGRNNLPRMLSAWEREMEVESVTQKAVPPVSKTISEDAPAPDDIEAAPQTDSATVTPDKKSSRLIYPADVRKLAVDMRRKGKKPGAIIRTIENKCGYAPDEKSLNSVLNRWEKAIG